MVNLEIKNLTKIYNKKTVLNNISFEVNDGEFLSILGPSGCGKTTLLKILIGIENSTSGEIIKNNDLQKATLKAMNVVKKMISLNIDNVDKYKGIPVENYLEVIDE